MPTQPQHWFLRSQASAIHNPVSKSCDFTEQRMHHLLPGCDGIHWSYPVLPVLARSVDVDRTLGCCMVPTLFWIVVLITSNNATPVNL